MLNLIKRNTPDIASCFVLENIEKADGKSVYTVREENGKIVLGGDCKISQAMAYYRYLKDYCKVNLSHCGNEKMPAVDNAPLPDKEIRFIIEQDKRVYMNYCTLGYSCAWWDWERWEREIDYMAMNGINMPLSVVGTEAVWYYTLRDFKYSDTGALEFLSGPAFWAWQLMGNIYGYFPLTDKSYIDSRLELGKKIIDREVELGMTPIQQGYSGLIPKSITRLKAYHKSRLNMVKPWCNFPVTYIVDPLDPLFKKFGRAFLEKQRQLFGAFHYYACDPFHENKPASKLKNYLWNVGRTIDTLYQEFDSESVWVMQAWSLYEPIVKSVPLGRLLVLDINSEKYKETEGFWGHDFVAGHIHNFGDRNTLHGSIDAIAANPYMSIKSEYPNACGTGLFMEGIRQNPLYYDLAFDMLTQSKNVQLDEWLKDYARRRYSSDEKCLVDAMQALRESCYSQNCTGRETGSIICARPSTNLQHTAPNDTLTVRYSNAKLLEAADLLLSAENASGDGYEFDVCDVVRQVLSNHENVLYRKVMDAFYAKDKVEFEQAANLFLKILEDMDTLLQTRPELTLYKNLADACALATVEKDQNNFELNLLSQLTVWGPMGRTVNYDYAWKEWGGLIKTYYLQRWHSFFEQLAEFFHKKHFKTETKKQHCERNEYLGSKFYRNFEKFDKSWLQNVSPEEPSGEDTVETARKLLEKYKRFIVD